MNTNDSIAAARDQLNRTLGFFARVDGKASVILAIDTSMLALLATRSAPYSNLGWVWLPISIALLGLAINLWNVYKEGFPSLDGGEESLLYFREIAKKSEVNYVGAWTDLSDERYVKDLLGQIWRNSVILRKKFDHVRFALIALGLAIPAWAVALALLSLKRPTL